MSDAAIVKAIMYPVRTQGDRLVLVALRSWLAGLHYEDASCWEAGWNVLSNELPPSKARELFSAMERLAFALREAGVAGSITWPISCRLANRHEILALAMAGLAQRGLVAQAMQLAGGLVAGYSEEAEAGLNSRTKCNTPDLI